jgi:hypothetical protein
MSFKKLKKHEIEAIIESAVDDIISSTFQTEFTDFEDVEYAVEFLKTKINELEADDFV